MEIEAGLRLGLGVVTGGDHGDWVVCCGK